MNILDYFHIALCSGLKPTLLQFTHPSKKTPLDILAINPTSTLEARSGKLYKNNLYIGDSLDIFEHLTLEESPGFFPAFIGFFAYEFARYNGLDTKSNNAFPDAFFHFYEDGLVVDDGIIVHQTNILHTLRESVKKTHNTFKTCVQPLLHETEFKNIVSKIKQRIRQGDVYQVNMSLPFMFEACDDQMLLLYQAMRQNNKSPFMGIMHHDDWWILSGSPERLFSLHHNRITTRPIAGTKRREFDHLKELATIHDLRSSAKENAEHAMLVDLLRNDLHQIADAGSVCIDEDRSIEFYSHVMHLVSEISATTNKSLKEIFAAIFPGGTITGAPKKSVMAAINDLESRPRGPYTGSLGYISSGYGTDFNILIRSVLKNKMETFINAGAGIVIDSDPEQEWHEINGKAQAVMDIIKGNIEPKPCRPTIKGPLLKKHDTPLGLKKAYVLFLENNDSFSFNIVDALRSLGADVEIICSDMHINQETKPTHLVIGPGPGNPEQMPWLTKIIDHFVMNKTPILGICLGHQALGYHFGANIKPAPKPVHGQSHAIHHQAQGLFLGLLSPLRFTRYHSLVINQAPKDFLVDAHSDDDCIMAIRHKGLPIFGVQFHPESYLSSGGLTLLANFLRETR